jgi:hypothetical protein
MDDSHQPAPPYDAWQAPEPAQGFSDRMLARLDAEQRPGPHPRSERASLPMARPRRWWLATVAMASVAAVLLLIVLRGSLHPQGSLRSRQPSSGAELGSNHRTTHALGDRGVAVAEPGAALSWHVDGEGAGVVTQQRGPVFYRIEHEDRLTFEVKTPQGSVLVTGTCFTVAVEGATTEVRVHEGSVTVQAGGETAELRAGESATVTGSRLQRGLAHTEPAPAPAPAVSMAQPMPKDLVERRAPTLNLDAATLAQWAKKCRVRSDMPPFEEEKPKNLAEWESYTRSMGGTAAEVEMVRDAFAVVEERAFSMLRDLYVQTTGDKAGVTTMTVDQMLHEISRTAEYQEVPEIYQQLAAERAGLREPTPVDHRTPLEVLLREILQQGDYFEAELARRLGPARARQLRERNQGWPGEVSDWEGCPKR